MEFQGSFIRPGHSETGIANELERDDILLARPAHGHGTFGERHLLTGVSVIFHTNIPCPVRKLGMRIAECAGTDIPWHSKTLVAGVIEIRHYRISTVRNIILPVVVGPNGFRYEIYSQSVARTEKIPLIVFVKNVLM